MGEVGIFPLDCPIPMIRIVVLLSLVLSFIAPVAVSTAFASEVGTASLASHSSQCHKHRAKKHSKHSKHAKHSKKKKKNSKKPYGFQL